METNAPNPYPESGKYFVQFDTGEICVCPHIRPLYRAIRMNIRGFNDTVVKTNIPRAAELIQTVNRQEAHA